MSKKPRKPLTRKTGLRRTGISRVSNRVCKAAAGDRVVRPRRGLRAKSRTNSNKHVDVAFRREYMESQPNCEMANLFPRYDWMRWVPQNESNELGRLISKYEDPTDPHHILWGQARRHDIRANLLAICREAHDFCHKFKVDGMVLALEAKRRKGELQWEELNRISRMDVRGWLSGKRCTFDWCEAYRLKLISPEQGGE